MKRCSCCGNCGVDGPEQNADGNYMYECPRCHYVQIQDAEGNILDYYNEKNEDGKAKQP